GRGCLKGEDAAAVLQRSQTGDLAKAFREVALVVESGPRGDAAERELGGGEEPLGFLDAERENVFHRREPQHLAEKAVEMRHRESGESGETGGGDLVDEMGLDVGDGPLQASEMSPLLLGG